MQDKIYGYLLVYAISPQKRAKGEIDVVTAVGVPAFQIPKQHPQPWRTSHLFCSDQDRKILTVAVALPPYIFIMSHVLSCTLQRIPVKMLTSAAINCPLFETIHWVGAIISVRKHTFCSQDFCQARNDFVNRIILVNWFKLFNSFKWTDYDISTVCLCFDFVFRCRRLCTTAFV